MRMSFLTLALICVLPLALGRILRRRPIATGKLGRVPAGTAASTISPPKDDAKSHPYSKAAIADSDTDDIPRTRTCRKSIPGIR